MSWDSAPPCLFQLCPATITTTGRSKLDPVLSRRITSRPSNVCPKLCIALRLTGTHTHSSQSGTVYHTGGLKTTCYNYYFFVFNDKSSFKYIYVYIFFLQQFYSNGSIRQQGSLNASFSIMLQDLDDLRSLTALLVWQETTGTTKQDFQHYF